MEPDEVKRYKQLSIVAAESTLNVVTEFAKETLAILTAIKNAGVKYSLKLDVTDSKLLENSLLALKKYEISLKHMEKFTGKLIELLEFIQNELKPGKQIKYTQIQQHLNELEKYVQEWENELNSLLANTAQINAEVQQVINLEKKEIVALSKLQERFEMLKKVFAEYHIL